MQSGFLDRKIEPYMNSRKRDDFEWNKLAGKVVSPAFKAARMKRSRGGS